MMTNEKWPGPVASILQSRQGQKQHEFMVCSNVVLGDSGSSTSLGHVTSDLEISYLLVISIYLLSD